MDDLTTLGVRVDRVVVIDDEVRIRLKVEGGVTLIGTAGARLLARQLLDAADKQDEAGMSGREK